MKQIFVGSTQRTKLYSNIRKAIMPTRIILIASLILLIAIPAIFHKKIFKNTGGNYSAVVYVQTDGGTGSAVYIGGDYLLSAAHVYEGMQIGDKCTIEFQNPNDTTASHITAQAELIALGDYKKNQSPENDYALLQIQGLDASRYAQHYTICENISSVKVGDEVTVEGYGGGTYVYTGGKMSNLTGGITQITDLFVVDAKAWQGNSGGALLNKNKEVIGIVVAGGAIDGINDGQTLAIKINKVQSYFRSKGHRL